MSEEVQTKQKPRFNYMLALISGPSIYMIHFLAIYFLVEGGCQSGLYRTQVLGFSLVNVLVVILTLIAAAVTSVIAWFSFRRWQVSRRAADDDSNSKFLSFSALGLNVYSTVVILLTGLPVLGLVLCSWI